MTITERAGGTKTQRERKAIAFLEELRLLKDTTARRDAIMRVFGEEYQRGFGEAWEEWESVQPETIPPPAAAPRKLKAVKP